MIKKLLDREPTEEMIRTALSACKFDGEVDAVMVSAMCKFAMALFDAAPELTVDMEPFGYLKRVNTSKCYLGNLSSDRPQEGFEAVYSATQLAALQAENERLRKDNKELEYRLADEVHAHSMAEDQLTESAILAKRITAERDELLESLKDIKEVFLNKFVWKGTSEQNTGVSRCRKEIMPIVEEAIAKYEGEKHANS